MSIGIFIAGAAVGGAIGAYLGYTKGGRVVVREPTQEEQEAFRKALLADAGRELESERQRLAAELEGLEAKVAREWERGIKAYDDAYWNAYVERQNDLDAMAALLEARRAELAEADNQLMSVGTSLKAAEMARFQASDTNKGVPFLSEKERSEVRALNEVAYRLSNPLPLYKAIFDLFYRAPMKEVIEVAGAGKVGGIYRLTHVESGASYVGQSVDIGNRWMAHARRGCGAEVGTLAGGKLYRALMEEGLWRFRWEVLEEVGDSKVLNEKEAFWIDSLATVATGYNSKRG